MIMKENIEKLPNALQAGFRWHLTEKENRKRGLSASFHVPECYCNEWNKREVCGR